jgi:hypothetical protein
MIRSVNWVYSTADASRTPPVAWFQAGAKYVV